jgi:2-aminoadipate transaminase
MGLAEYAVGDLEVIEGLNELLITSAQEDVISFGGGFPDPRLVQNKEEVKEMIDAAHGGKKWDKSLSYNPAAGYKPFREEYAVFWNNENRELLEAAGEPIKFKDIDYENILITDGSQPIFSLFAETFISEDDLVFLGIPTYVGALFPFSSSGCGFLGIPVEKDGLDVEALARELEKRRDDGDKLPKYGYVVPDFQNPMGATMSLEKRKKLLELAEEYDFYILEDSPYGGLNYYTDRLPSLKALDTNDRVLSIASISKIIAPGYRIAMAVADKETIKELEKRKLGRTLATPSFVQALLCYFYKNNGKKLKENTEKIKNVYAPKHDEMVRIFNEYWLGELGIDGEIWEPGGGMFVPFIDRKHRDACTIAKQMLEQFKIFYCPGNFFDIRYYTERVDNPYNASAYHIGRWNFTQLPKEQITEWLPEAGRAYKKLST